MLLLLFLSIKLYIYRYFCLFAFCFAFFCLFVCLFVCVFVCIVLCFALLFNTKYDWQTLFEISTSVCTNMTSRIHYMYIDWQNSKSIYILHRLPQIFHQVTHILHHTALLQLHFISGHNITPTETHGTHILHQLMQIVHHLKRLVHQSIHI